MFQIAGVKSSSVKWWGSASKTIVCKVATQERAGLLLLAALSFLCLARCCLIEDMNRFNMEPNTLSRTDIQSQVTCDERLYTLLAWGFRSRVENATIDFLVNSHSKYRAASVSQALEEILWMLMPLRQEA